MKDGPYRKGERVPGPRQGRSGVLWRCLGESPQDRLEPPRGEGREPGGSITPDDHDRPGTEILLDPWSPTTVTPTTLRLWRPGLLTTLPPPAVQDDLHLLVTGEVPLEIIVETRLVPRHDEEVTGH